MEMWGGGEGEKVGTWLGELWGEVGKVKLSETSRPLRKLYLSFYLYFYLSILYLSFYIIFIFPSIYLTYRNVRLSRGNVD